MHPGEQDSSGPDLASASAKVTLSPQPHPSVGNEGRTTPTARRWWIAAAWIGGGLALLALFFRISLSYAHDSDGANSALQAWDMLHGNLLLHGWVLGDATYYTFELPLYAVTEFFFGLHSVAIHAGAALTYLILTASAVAVARADSRGWSTAARCGVVIAVLSAPLLTLPGVYTLLELPDHTGTGAILLVCFLLIDRAPARRFTPPLLCAILGAGQLSDATVLYVAVPAILVVCAYRVLATRNIRTGDAAIAVAAVASVPLALLAHAALVHFGGYAMYPPGTAIAPIGRWWHHLLLALHGILNLFGAVYAGSVLGAVGAVFGLVCLLAAVGGFGKVIWTWRTASRAEQLLCVTIVINISLYVVSTVARHGPGEAREFAVVLPCGAILAARACVPSRIAGVWGTRVAIAAAAAAVALLPLAAAATRPPATPVAVRLATWLEAHRLTYGLAGYWDASAVSVQSGGRVEVRAVAIPQQAGPGPFGAGSWETKPSWYDASQHDATFVIADPHLGPHPHGYLTVAEFEKYLPRPVATYQVARRIILIYRTNLLRHVVLATPPNGSGG